VVPWSQCESKYDNGFQMRRAYQTEWHGIEFHSFTGISASAIADATFYGRFYKKFYEKYTNWDDLNRTWVADKLSLADYLINTGYFHKGSRILSVGCGTGIIEKKLIDEGYNNVEITEVSQEPLAWIRKYLPDSRIHVGVFPDCLPANRYYDFIYLSSIDYCFTTTDLIVFLKSVKERLLAGGKCLLLSTSYDYKPRLFTVLLRHLKDMGKVFFEKTGLRSRGQFWGYVRSDSEFRTIMQRSGFAQISDGLVADHQNYYVEGCAVDPLHSPSILPLSVSDHYDDRVKVNARRRSTFPALHDCFHLYLKFFSYPIYIIYLIILKSFNYQQSRAWRRKYEIHATAYFAGSNIILEGEGRIIMGEFSHVTHNSWLSAFENTKIEIGKYVRIADNVVMLTSNTKANQLFNNSMDRNYGDIVIGDFTWIGCNVFIKEGVRIGRNVVVGANSVVARDIPDNSVYVGDRVIYKIINE
jgi:acetyltransferase-like isoleucine patch superfamily enzyme